jgi:hypothetical protein
MATDERALTPEEQAALDTIEATLARPVTDTQDTASIAGIANLLRTSTPQAAANYRQNLRERVLAEAQRQHATARRFTRRRILAAGFAAAAVGGAVLVVPQTRAAVAEIVGWRAASRATPLPIAMTGGQLGWVGPDDAQREFSLRTIAHERWTDLARFPAPEPTPGNIVTLPGGRLLPVPGTLPAEFTWQGIIASDSSNPNSVPFMYRGQSELRGGGGGSGLPWERPLQYDRYVAVYLIGGDPTDRLLVLQQLKPDARGEVAISAFQMEVLPQIAPVLPPGVTAQSGIYGARTILGLLVEPARDKAGLTVQAGPNALHSTIVAGAAAWWFSGEWAADGHWLDDGTWISVVWSRDGFIYCLSGQQLGLDELLRVAESLP